MEATCELPVSDRGYRPLRTLAKVTTALFTMYSAALVVLLVTVHQMLGLVRAPADERDYAAIRALASRVESFETLGVVVWLGCVLTFCLWTYRAVANARRASGLCWTWSLRRSRSPWCGS